MRDNNLYYPKIGQSFAMYEAFRAQKKTATSCPVELRQPKSDKEYIGRSPVQTTWEQFHCEFEATKSPKVLMKYNLKLFANDFDSKPCFRFKSRGSYHFNTEVGGGLCKRPVECPHFYRVDNRGILEAYRTPAMDDPAESARVVNDPQVGADHFCKEANLFSPTGGSIVLNIIVDGLGFLTTDPLADATFPTQ